jgi:hypothetical protein
MARMALTDRLTMLSLKNKLVELHLQTLARFWNNTIIKPSLSEKIARTE